jgi:cell division septum initiation protein DivIVA
MSIFNKIKKGIEHAAGQAASEVSKAVSSIDGAQKDVIATVQKQAENLLSAAYEAQKNILSDTQKEAEGIINAAYEQQKEIIKNAQDKAITVGTSELYDIIVKTFENGNPLMKIIGMVLKSFRKQILDAIQNELK